MWETRIFMPLNFETLRRVMLETRVFMLNFVFHKQTNMCWSNKVLLNLICRISYLNLCQINADLATDTLKNLKQEQNHQQSQPTLYKAYEESNILMGSNALDKMFT